MAEPTALGREGSRFGIFEVRRGIVRSSVLLGLENCEVVGDCDDHDEDAVKDDGDDYVHHHDDDDNDVDVCHDHVAADDDDSDDDDDDDDDGDGDGDAVVCY